MSREEKSRDFVAFIPNAIESDWDEIWAPRLAGFPVNLCYAEWIQGSGLVCATYVFDRGPRAGPAGESCSRSSRGD
jgi:hypothetical protein